MQIKHVVVTGIRFTDKDGIQKMGNLYATENSYEMFSFPYVGGSYSGTGDLFASCLCAGIARGDDIPSIIQTAGTFIELALSDSVKERIDRNDGVNYEKYLSLLIPKTSDSRVKDGEFYNPPPFFLCLPNFLLIQQPVDICCFLSYKVLINLSNASRPSGVHL